jgi:type IV pilus assembly protein PilQ
VVSLIKLLDKPIPQIMIEARIVEASTNFSRDIGIQWGGTQKLDAAHGNPIGATFPNSMTMTGGPTMGQTASGSGNYFVNLPAAAGAGSGGAVGFTFGSISKSLNLDLVLSALESTGEGKIVSQPRVSALDNKEARITQGTSIPYPVTSASGANTVFVEANLSLTVTPHATPDNKIFMKIQATKNAPGSILGSSGQPSIDKNEAMTEILLADGETAVIGGILSMQKSANYVKVPFFGDLPLIGWFFKKKTNSESKKEMLIFITPRLIKQDVI